VPELIGPVASNGDIIIPVESGAIIPIRQIDANSAPIDISAIPMRFFVRGRIDKMLTADPNYAQGKLLTITQDEADKLSSKGQSFSVLDVSNPLVPLPVWSALICRKS
jgi:hypothetical protein